MADFQAILCDDVRVEDTGKYIVIGAYTDTFAVDSFPLYGMFGLLLVVSGTSPGENTLHIAVGAKSAKPLESTKEFIFEASKEGRATLRFSAIEVKADENDTIEIHCGVSADDLRLVEEIPVRHIGVD